MPLPRINDFLSRDCHSIDGTPFALQRLSGCNGAAENDMKIYLLMMIMGTLLTAVHFTTAPKQRSKPNPQ